jgi:SHS2 domain-containing protein
MEEYRWLEHTADAAVQVRADSREGLVRASVAALRELLDPGEPRHAEIPTVHLELTGEGPTPAEQLVDLLNEWLFTAASRHVIPQVERVEWPEPGGGPLTVTCTVEHEDGAHRFGNEVKAVTYHEAEVTRENGTWRARWIADV